MAIGNGAERRCELPGGLIDEVGDLHREAELAPLTGREEELLAGLEHEAPAVLVTRVLARCVLRVGSIRPLTEDMARRLLVADRQYLLLKLREISYGARVSGTLGCPWPSCGAKVDIDFDLRDIPVRRSDRPAARYRIALSPAAAPSDERGVQQTAIIFRLPNGGDQEALAPLLAANPARALTHLLELCIEGSEPGWDDTLSLAQRLNSKARQEIERAMDAEAPGLDLDMHLACPECARAFTAPFDLEDFFFGELRISQDLLYRQVHYLAYHYHWSEREILRMPRDKRLAYIGILADEIEALNDAV